MNRAAARVLMKILYAARMAWFDLLKAVCSLATSVCRWRPQDGDRLKVIMRYISRTKDLRQVGWCGDLTAALTLSAFADADFAGDMDTSKSTSGGCMLISGPHTSFMLSAVSKKQTVVSHSTPEAELVAAEHVLRTVLIPALDLWQLVLGRCPKAIFYEDNQACIQVCNSGSNPTVRHLGRTHRVAVHSLHERFSAGDITMVKVDTKEQRADIFTKPFTNAATWEALMDLIQVVDGSKWWGPEHASSDTPAGGGSIKILSHLAKGQKACGQGPSQARLRW